MEHQIGKILYIVKYILIFIILICSIISIITVLHYEDGYLASRADTYNWHNPNFKYISVKSISHDLAYTDDIYETPLDILKADEGFEIVSYSKNWTGEVLNALYRELLKNRHGSEIEYLDSIIVYPDSPPSDISGAWGSYNTAPEDMEYIFKISPIYDAQLRFFMSFEKGQICLYYGDLIDDVSQMARTLSHEYGHHYTFHYFSNPYDENSLHSLWDEYYEIRGLNEYEQVKTKISLQEGQDYRDNHMWFLHEIAAEDYWLLMGSTSYKTVREYMDVEAALQNSIDEYEYSWNIDFDENTINVYPQENYIIPLPQEVKGLDTFFNSFIEPEYEGKKDRDICRPELTYMKVENKNDSYYQFEWTDCGADKDALYTFVGIDNVGNILYPIKTVRAGEPREAKIGRVSLETLYSIWSLEDGIAEGNKYFRLYVIYDDGHMVSSDPIYIEFD